MLASYKFVFNLKNERLGKGKKALVQLRVTINRKSKYYTTGIHLEKLQWNGADNAWVVNTPLAADYNALLLEIITKVRKAELNAAQSGQPLSHEVVQQIIRGKDTGSFVEFMISESESRNDIAERTRGHAKLAAQKLRHFGIVNFSDLTLDNIQRAHNELLKDNECSTVDKFHDVVNCYVKRAVAKDFLPMDKNPYLKFERKKVRYGDRKYLTDEGHFFFAIRKLPTLPFCISPAYSPSPRIS